MLWFIMRINENTTTEEQKKTTLQEQIKKSILESEKENAVFLEEQTNNNLSKILNPNNNYKRIQEEILKGVFN